MPGATRPALRWPGFTPERTLVLPVARDARARDHAVVLDEARFEPKAELHVTVVGRTLGARIAQALADGTLQEAALASAFEALDWSWSDTGAYVWLRKDKPEGRAESVVELIEMPAMAAFHFALGRKLGERLPVPPAHVTRWVRGNPEGIGVPDEDTLRALTVRLVAREELGAAR